MKAANLVIPIAGQGSRFAKDGYKIDKPMIEVQGMKLIEHAMNSVEIQDFNIIFCIKKSLETNYEIVKFLKEKFGNEIQCKIIEEETSGPLMTCTYAFDLLNQNIPTAVFTLDVNFSPRLSRDTINMDESDALSFTFKANNPHYSYSKKTKEGDTLISRVAEKEVISEDANVGVYVFKDTKLFQDYVFEELNNCLISKKESHIAPILNNMIRDNLIVRSFECERIYIFGTPLEKIFFENHILKRKKQSFIVGLASDHSGYHRKELAKEILIQNDIQHIDYGCFDASSCDYYQFVDLGCNGIKNNEIDYLFSFCRSGQGVNLAANKYSDSIISALIYDDFAFRYAILHSCANVFAFPSMLDEQDFKYYIEQLKTLHFEGGRHSNRLIGSLYKINT